jgi:hypothetical protein
MHPADTSVGFCSFEAFQPWAPTPCAASVLPNALDTTLLPSCTFSLRPSRSPHCRCSRVSSPKARAALSQQQLRLLEVSHLKTAVRKRRRR